jgi:hypothetical protein
MHNVPPLATGVGFGFTVQIGPDSVTSQVAFVTLPVNGPEQLFPEFTVMQSNREPPV